MYAKSARTEGAEAWQFSSEGYEQIGSTGAASTGGRWHFQNRPPLKFIQSSPGPIQRDAIQLCTFCSSAQHSPDAPFRPTWAKPAPIWHQRGPNLDRKLAQAGPLGATWLQHESHGRPNPKSEILKTPVFTGISYVFWYQ